MITENLSLQQKSKNNYIVSITIVVLPLPLRQKPLTKTNPQMLISTHPMIMSLNQTMNRIIDRTNLD